MAPPIEPFNKQNLGMILSEGAGAIVLAREGFATIERAHPGGYFRGRSEAGKVLKRILCDVGQMEIDFVISSANGTFVDQAESQALQEVVSDALAYTGKPALGESVGAAGLWQIILAAQALRSKELPPVLHANRSIPLRLPLLRTPIPNARRAIVLSCGLNQQAAGLRMAIQ
jgi:3-oxoacyl-(acyl-carrier-protein) synthase